MTDKEKLVALMERFAGGSQQVFAQLIGEPRSNVATWMHRGRITANGREAILDAFPQVSREWLAGPRRGGDKGDKGGRDAGEMLVEEDGGDVIRFSRRELVPLFEECRASCGVVEQFGRREFASGFVHVPGVRALAALPAEGVSMEPTICDGDVCLVGEAVSLEEVDGRKIYLVVTRGGQCMFKRILDEGRDAADIFVLSENPDYVPQAQRLAKADVLRVYPLKYVVHKLP